MTDNKKGLGELLNESLTIFMQNFSRLVTVVTFVYIPLAVVHVVFFTGVDMEQVRATNDIAVIGPVTLKSLLYGIAMFLASFLYQIAIVKTIKSIDDKGPIEPADAYSSAFPIFGSVLLVALLATVKIFLWSLLLIIPGVLFAIYYTFSVFAVIIDGQKGNGALKYSKDIVRSNIGKFIGNMIVAWLVTLPCLIIINIIITTLFGAKTGGNAGLMPTTGEALARFCSVVIYVYVTIFSYLLYQELKRHINPPEAGY